MKHIFVTLLAAALSISAAWAVDFNAFYKDLPFPVQAPAQVQIPASSVSILDFGGNGDGIADNTEAFANALAALEKMGGGRLNVPRGIFLTGPIVLKDRMELHLERGAMILFTPDRAVYINKGRAEPCISASKRCDIAITGEGVIDGNGAFWRPVKRSKVSDVEWKDYQRMGGTVIDNKLWYPFELKHIPDIAGNPKDQETLPAVRPSWPNSVLRRSTTSATAAMPWCAARPTIRPRTANSCA